MMELLVVMGISVTALAGLMSVYTVVYTTTGEMSRSSEASTMAEMTMEELRGLSIEEIEALPSYASITTAGWGPVDYHNGHLVGRFDVNFRRRVSAIQPTSNTSLIRLRVDIEWTDTGDDAAVATPSDVHSVGLEMIRTREETF